MLAFSQLEEEGFMMLMLMMATTVAVMEGISTIMGIYQQHNPTPIDLRFLGS